MTFTADAKRVQRYTEDSSFVPLCLCASAVKHRGCALRRLHADSAGWARLTAPVERAPVL